MSLTQWLAKKLQKTRGDRRRKALRVERLDGRIVPANFYIAAGDTAGLRNAILTANSNFQDDVIYLAPGTYNFTARYTVGNVYSRDALPVIGPDVGNSASPGRSVTIRCTSPAGATFTRTAADGVNTWNAATMYNGEFRFLQAQANNYWSKPTLALEGIKFTNGNLADVGQEGGAVLASDAHLKVTNCSFENNRARIGGAIFVTSGSLTLQSATFNRNSANMSGGAVRVISSQGTHTVTVTASKFEANKAGLSNVDADGGGLAVVGNATSVTSSSFEGNTASRSGGGLYVAANATISSSTFAQNTAMSGSGGGVAVLAEFGRAELHLTMTNSTVHANTASAGGGGVFFQGRSATFLHDTITDNVYKHSDTKRGGGVWANNPSTDYPVTFQNTIVANNKAVHPTTGIVTLTDIAGPITKIKYSLVRAWLHGFNVYDEWGNYVGVDPQLGPLQFNGGLTKTRMPLAISPAINHGEPNYAPIPLYDQRGGWRVLGGRSDIGAVERQ